MTVLDIAAPDFNHTAMERDGVPALEGLVRVGRLPIVWQTLRERNVASVKAAIRSAVRSRVTASSADLTRKRSCLSLLLSVVVPFCCCCCC